MLKHTLCVIALFGIAAAAPASARDDMRASKFDKNQDGVLSRAEKDELKQTHLKYADVNRDGTLSDDEWSIYQASRHDQYAAAYQRRDGNHTISQYRNLPDKVMYDNRWNKYAPAAGTPRRDERGSHRYREDNR